MPKHSHGIQLPQQFYQQNLDGGQIIGGNQLLDKSVFAQTYETGNSQPHTNMPPYLTVNIYVRKE